MTRLKLFSAAMVGRLNYVGYGNELPGVDTQDDYVSSPTPQLQCDLTIRQGGYEVEDFAMAFGGDPVYLTCDARCKGPGATPALGWYKGKSQMPLPSTRGR